MSFKASAGIAATIWLRTWKKVVQRPVVLIFSLVQPLMWMLFFGFLFQGYTLDSVPGSPPYLHFLMPGICVMTVLFGASQSGTGLIRDMQTGFLARMLQTSAPTAVLLGGKLAADVSRQLAQAFVVCLLGLALGASVVVNASSIASAIAYVAVFAFAYSCFSCWIALLTRSQEAMGVFIQAVNMPILFTSSALVPSRQMPSWLARLAEWNPLSASADAVRTALLHGRAHISIASFLITGITAALLFFLSLSTLKRYREN